MKKKTIQYHKLKIWPEFFQAKIDGKKPWEYRSAIDRTFTVGDEVLFIEFCHDKQMETGRTFGPVVITNVLRIDAVNDIFTHTMPSNETPHSKTKANGTA